MKKYYSIYAAAAALLLTACTQDIFQNGDAAVSDSKTISFTAQTVDIQEDTRSTAAPEALPLTGDGLNLWLMPSETPMVSDATRGTQINSVEALSNFGVSAYRHGAIPSEKTQNEYLTDNNLKPDFFYNLEATKITDTQKFKLTKDFFWPTDDDVLSFFAYAPYGDENVELSAATEEGPQSINFKVDTDVKKQVDLITAQASTKSHLNTSVAPSVALNFTHQLTGIRFVIGDQFLKGWVKSISLKGVYTQGKYTIGEGWTLDDTKKGNFTISYNLDKPVAGDPGEEVSASDEVFMMIPHTFAADDAATIEVVYNDKYTDYVVSAPLKGQTWKAGKTVTYAITSNKLTTLRIGQIQFATTPEGAPKRIWAAGDKIGMYVVGSDGKKLKHKNIPVTFDGANWNIDHTTSEGTIYKLAGESFYFYYPYSNVSNGQPTGYPEQCPELKATAPVFFEGVIDYFDYKKDQSTLANFLATDLQVARAEDDGRASMIKATMLRQVGLARFKFATSKTIPQTITYTYSGANATTNTKTTSGSTTIAPSTNFMTNKPYLGNNATYFFYTKAKETTTFNCNPSDENHWLETVNITLDAGEYTSDTNMKTVQDYRKDWTCSVSTTWKYPYNTAKGCYTFTSTDVGNYTMECWGAQGGHDTPSYSGGKGAYTSGVLNITGSLTLYVFVGQQGVGRRTETTSSSSSTHAGGWNGGGTTGAASAGGGATDIRLTSGAWNNFNSLKSRIMVAASGGGSDNSRNGTYAGALTGIKDNGGGGGTQTAGGAASGEGATAGGFGYAGTSGDGGGAGSGYYGGGGGGPGDNVMGGSGSCFISGYSGCNAISSSSTSSSITHTGSPNHYSGYVFTNTVMKAGNASMPNPTSSGNETGHTGNGYCRIILTH